MISILGLQSELLKIDRECEQFLDFGLMDYSREVNKKHDSPFYCMLCHKEHKIVHSHTIPQALLKLTSEGGRSKGNQELVKMGPAHPSDVSVKPVKSSAHYMLCDDCDNVVVSGDENFFMENVVKRVYQTSPDVCKLISYDKRLHRFCAGIIFRNLPLSRVAGCTNANDIHKLYHYCRSVVMPSASAEKEFEIAIFFTPSVSEDEKDVFLRGLNAGSIPHLSINSISGITSINLANKIYFFVAHVHIFNIVAFLEPVPLEYKRFLVNPDKGKLKIPANKDRLRFIPPGLLTVLKEEVEKFKILYFEYLRRLSLDIISPAEEEKPATKPKTFNLLPPGYELDRKSCKLTIKGTLLFHHTYQLPSSSHTVFLAIQDKKPYVILHNHFAPNVSQTLGYFIYLPEFIFKEELHANQPILLRCIKYGHLDFRFPAQAIPAAFKCTGLQNYQSVLYHHLNR